MSLSLATTPEEFRELALAAIDVVARYYRELSNMPVMPVTTAAEVRQLLDLMIHSLYSNNHLKSLGPSRVSSIRFAGTTDTPGSLDISAPQEVPQRRSVSCWPLL